MHARHHRRLVILKLRIFRQFLPEMPDHPGCADHGDQEHDRPAREQQAEEAKPQPHGRSPAPKARFVIAPKSWLAPTATMARCARSFMSVFINPAAAPG